MDEDKQINNLNEEITKAKNSLSTDRLDMSFGEIMSMYERNEIIIDPDFQRLFRWNEYQKTRFIESLLLGIPIPPIFVAEDENGKWELVDGLQRISTLFSFFGILKTLPEKNNWKLVEGDLINNLNDLNINNLPLKYQLNLKRASCRIEIIKWDSKMDMRYELFNRLNTGGSPLTDQEIRNCIFRGTSNNFNEYLISLSNLDKFKSIINPTEKQIEELYLQELILRWSSLYENVDKVKKIMSLHMTDFMKEAILNDNFNFAKKDLFIRMINLLEPLGFDIFRGSNKVFSTSYYDAITVSLAENIDFYENKPELLKTKIEELKLNSDFSSLMGSAANSKTRVKRRIEIARTIFKNN